MNKRNYDFIVFLVFGIGYYKFFVDVVVGSIVVVINRFLG